MPAKPGKRATRRFPLRQLIAAPLSVLGGLLALAIAYALVAAAVKHGYGIEVPKPYGLLHKTGPAKPTPAE
jgi:hypothetical protein